MGRKILSAILTGVGLASALGGRVSVPNNNNNNKSEIFQLGEIEARITYNEEGGRKMVLKTEGEIAYDATVTHIAAVDYSTDNDGRFNVFEHNIQEDEFLESPLRKYFLGDNLSDRELDNEKLEALYKTLREGKLDSELINKNSKGEEGLYFFGVEDGGQGRVYIYVDSAQINKQISASEKGE